MIGLYETPAKDAVTRYGRGSALLIATAPTVEPILKADAKLFARVEAAITADDGLFDSLIAAARQKIEAHTNRALMTQTWDWFLDSPPAPILEVPLPPLASVTGIYFTDEDDTEGAAISSALYVVDLARNRIYLKDGESWGYTSLRSFKSTRIRFVAGYGATAADASAGTPIAGSVPADILTAIRRTVLHHYENRDDVVVGTITAELPMAAKALLQPYVVPRC